MEETDIHQLFPVYADLFVAFYKGNERAQNSNLHMPEFCDNSFVKIIHIA